MNSRIPRVPNPFLPPHAALTRRQLMVRAGALGAAGLSLPALLAACGGGDDDSGSSASLPESGGSTPAGGSNKLYFENWPGYIDPTADGLTGTVDRFIEATGIDFQYTETFNDNVEYFAKIQPILGNGDTIDPDIIAPTGWLAGRLLTLGWLDKLPLDMIPNAANLETGLRNPSWDPTGEYSLPWQSTIAGIAYNMDITGRELKSTADLFDPAFKGKVAMLTEMRDTMGLLMLAEGIDISNVTTFEEAGPAFERLEQAKNDGQIRDFTGNDYMNDLSAGNFAACVGWSGDIAQLARDNPALRFVIPEEGGTLGADTMVLPAGAKNRDSAAKWMDFVYDPVNAAQIAAYIQYISPVEGVREEIAKIDPELAESELMFPSDEAIARTHAFASLSEDVEAQYDAAFSAITGQ